MKRISLVLVSFLTLAMCLIPMANAQQLNAASTVTTQLTIPESLTISSAGGPFVLPANGSLSNSVNFTYAWNVNPANHSQGTHIAGWLGSATAALAAGSVNVPSSNVQFTSSDAIPSSPCTQAADSYTGSLAGATCFAVGATPSNGLAGSPSGSNTVATELNIINPAGIPAGSYAGTFVFDVVIP